MSLFEQWPYTNFHDLNLVWILKTMENLKKTVEEFIRAEKLKFADPIQWDITAQYAKGTIVLDSIGNAYLSVQPVPSGVELNNEDYWLEIFNFSNYVSTANKNLTINVETNTDIATSSYNVDDWLIWDTVLYKVTAAIDIDDHFIIGTNIVHFTVEDFVKAFTSYITTLVNQYKAQIDASEAEYRQQLADDIASTTASLQQQLNLAISGATVDSEVINARLAADGITYATLGEAIRTQIYEANINAISLISSDYFNFDKVTGEYVRKEDGVFAATANWFRTNKIQCNGTKYIYVGPLESPNEYNAFYDKTGTFISNVVIPSNSHVAGQKVEVPSNAYYFACSAPVAVMDDFAVRMESYTDKKLNLLSNSDDVLFSMTANDGYFPIKWTSDEYVRREDGVFAATTNWSRSDYMYCHGMKKVFAGPLATTDVYNAFYDKDLNFISSVTFIATDHIADSEVSVPDNAYYIAVSIPNTALSEYKLRTDIPTDTIRLNNLDKELAIKAMTAAPNYSSGVQDPSQRRPWRPVIMIVTDVHDDFESFNRALDFADECEEVICTISLGDFTTFGNLTRERTIELFTSHKKPVYRILGNHELLYNDGDMVTLMNLYYNNDIVSHNGEIMATDKPYWYKDITVNNTFLPNKKVRILGLCQFEGPNNSVNVYYSNDQLTWLCNLLDNTDSDTSIIALSHYEVGLWDGVNAYNDYFTPSPFYRYSHYDIKGGEPVDAIIDAWIHGSTVTVVNHEVTFTHTFASAHPNQFITWLSGHQHEDYVYALTPYSDQIDIGFSCTCESYTQAGYGDLPRRKKDVSKDCVTLVGINWFDHSVDLLRLGSDVTLDMRNRKYTNIKLP